MDITIIGTGNMARGIATRALEGGHGVTLLGHGAGEGGGARHGAPGRGPRRPGRRSARR